MPSRRSCLIGLLVSSLGACSDQPPTAPAETYSVRITPDSARVLPNDTVPLNAEIRNSHGELVTTEKVAWSSSDTTVAIVVPASTPGPMIIARNPGRATITATSPSGDRDSLTMSVTGNGACGSIRSQHRANDTLSVWRAADSPHLVRDSIVLVKPLTIEAGSVVCLTPNAKLLVRGGGALNAIGTSDRRISFLPLDTAATWGGVNATPMSLSGAIAALTFDHVIVNSGDISIGYFATATITNTAIHHGGFNDSGDYGRVTLRNDTITDGNVGVEGGVFENVVVQRGSVGLFCQLCASPIVLNGGRIEDSPGTALTIGSSFSAKVPRIQILAPPAIVRSKGAILEMPASMFSALWPTANDQASLLNNINKTVSLWNYDWGDLHLRGGLTWHLFYPFSWQSKARSLTVDAGAAIALSTNLFVAGPISMNGTVAQPVRVSGAGINATDTAASSLRYVNLDSTSFSSTDRNTVNLDHVNGAAANVTIGSRRSTLSAIQLVGSAPLRLAADSIIATAVSAHSATQNAIEITGSGIQLRDCDITNNVGDGIFVSGGSGLQIRNCAIEANVGAGVNNTTSSPVDAKQNWWGDPAGPNGPTGDGVAGPVEYSNPLTSRPTRSQSLIEQPLKRSTNRP